MPSPGQTMGLWEGTAVHVGWAHDAGHMPHLMPEHPWTQGRAMATVWSSWVFRHGVNAFSAAPSCCPLSIIFYRIWTHWRDPSDQLCRPLNE